MKLIINGVLIPILVTVVAGILLYNILKPDASLIYYIEDTFPFEDNSENFSIYHINIVNDGDEFIEDVTCHISFGYSVIKKYNVNADPTITYEGSIVDDSYHLKIPNLNSGENVSIAIFASSKKKTLSPPKVLLRGKGITGDEASKQIEKYKYFILMIIFIYTSALISLGLSSWIIILRYKRKTLYTIFRGEEIYLTANWNQLNQILLRSFDPLSLRSFRGDNKPYGLGDYEKKRWFNEGSNIGFGELMVQNAGNSWKWFKIYFYDTDDEKRFLEIEVDCNIKKVDISCQLDNYKKLNDFLQRIEAVFQFKKRLKLKETRKIY